MPSEQDLIRKYGISRQTVRIALQRLATEGQIKKVQGKGTFVSEPSKRAQISGMLAAEDRLESKNAAITSRLIEAGVFREPIQLYLDELGLPARSSAFKFIFLKLANQTPIALEVRYLPVELGSRLDLDDLNNHRIENVLANDIETDICRIKYRVVGETLMERATELLKVPEGSPGLVQFETHFNYLDKAIMTGKMIFLSERVEITFEKTKEINTWINKKVNHELRIIKQ